MQNRRTFLACAAAGAATLMLPRRGAAASAAAPAMTPQEALAALAAGNRRFVKGATLSVDHTERREALAAGQAPFAIVLSCSDSRVPPEIIFDRGLGELFVVRVAGNFADADGIGSMQYAVAHFKSAAILVLGHTACGAVHATVDNVKAHSPKVPGNIQDVVTAIAPAVRAVEGRPGDVYANATAENVRRNVALLKNTKTIIGEAVSAGHLEIAGGIYDLKTGKVAFL